MLVFLRCVCMCVYVCVCACVYVDVWGVCGCACVCVCDMLICFLSALGSHEMGRHKLPIIIIFIKGIPLTAQGSRSTPLHVAATTLNTRTKAKEEDSKGKHSSLNPHCRPIAKI